MEPQPPTSPYPRPNMQPGSEHSCPQCNSAQTKEIKYTWWGGILAPKLMHLQKCEACGFQFNRVTRQSTKNAVIAYNAVAWVLAFIIFFVIAFGAAASR